VANKEEPKLDDLGEAAPEYDVDDAGLPSPRRRALTIAAVILGVILALGVVTWAIGIGPFGYRLFAYGNVNLFVYNGTPHFAELEIDGAEYEIKPYEGEMLELTGGELEIDTTLRLVKKNPETGVHEITDEREHLETKSFTGSNETNWLYHVATEESTCLAITDMKAFYTDSGKPDPNIIGKVFKDERLRPLDYENVLYPQDALPDKIPGEIVWLAVVNCKLLKESPHLAKEKIGAPSRGGPAGPLAVC